MHRNRALGVLLSVAVVLTTFAGLVVLTDFVGTASADHDMIGNFTINPRSATDRQPGADGAGTQVLVTSDGDIHPSNGLKTLEFIRASSDDFDFDGCNQLDVRVFGLDKGNDDPGTQTDVNLLSNAERVEFNEDEIFIDMVDSGDGAVAFETDDQLVAVLAGCIENPDEAGWYQVTGKLNGTRSNGSPAGVAQQSHYFAICDCESRQQAVDELGPPPSADEEPTPEFSAPDAEQVGNATVDLGSHQPGATTRYTTYATAAGSKAATDFDEVDRFLLYGNASDFSACSSAAITEFGSDRGNDGGGRTIDESLTEHIQGAPYTTADVFGADFWERTGPGPSTTFNGGDQVIFETVDCVQNPGEPGWYTLSVEVTGASGGRQESMALESRQFYVCDCDSRAEAEQKLGQPGQSGGSTSTPTPTPSQGNSTPTATATPGSATTATATASPTPTVTAPATPTPTATPSPTPSPTPAATATPTATASPTPTRTSTSRRTTTATRSGGTPQRTAGGQPRTPTIAQGPGFGAVTALLALVGSALLAVRGED
jgi:PGF-CTERM protein